MIEHYFTVRVLNTLRFDCLPAVVVTLASILHCLSLSAAAAAAEPTWRRGEPDLVLSSQEAYPLKMPLVESTRSFVLPIPLADPQYIRAVEVFAGHPDVQVAKTIWVFRRTELDHLCDDCDVIGFTGSPYEKSVAVGQRVPLLSHESLSESSESEWAWRLDRDQVFVIELQFDAVEQDALIRPSIGVYFADRPHNAPAVIWLDAGQREAGAASTEMRGHSSQLTLARDAEIVAFFPIMGTSCETFVFEATAPAGRAATTFKMSFERSSKNPLVVLDHPMQVTRGTVIALRDQKTENEEQGRLRDPATAPQSTLAVYIHSTDEGNTLANLESSRQNAWESQRALCDARLQKDPRDLTSRFALGMLYAQRDQSEKAARYWRELTAMAPDHIPAHLQLAKINNAQNKPGLASAHYAEVLRVDPDHALANFGYANLLLTQRKTAEAIAHLHRAVQRDPSFTEAHMNLAILSRRSRNHDKEIKHFRLAIQSQPHLMRPRAALASALADQGRFDEALAELDDALTKRSTDSLLLFTKGRLLERSQELDQAVGVYQQLLRHHPESIKGMNALAWILVTHPNPAVRDVEQALYLSRYSVEATAGRNPQYLSTLAGSLAAAGRFTEAVDQVDSAIALLRKARSNPKIIQALLARKKQYLDLKEAATKAVRHSSMQPATKEPVP